MQIESEDLGAVVVVRLAGEFDVTESPRFADAIERAISGRRVRVVVDVVGLTFIDSSALAALVRAERRARAAECRLVVARPRAFVAQVFSTLGIDRAIPVVAALEDPGPNDDAPLRLRWRSPSEAAAAFRTGRVRSLAVNAIRFSSPLPPSGVGDPGREDASGPDGSVRCGDRLVVEFRPPDSTSAPFRLTGSVSRVVVDRSRRDVPDLYVDLQVDDAAPDGSRYATWIRAFLGDEGADGAGARVPAPRPPGNLPPARAD